MDVRGPPHPANVWRLHNYDQEAMLQLQTQAGKTVEETTTEVNRARKEAQLAIGDKLSTLESRWAALVSKNLSIRAANLTAAAVALIVGIGNLTLDIGAVTLEGIALGSVGIIVIYPLMRWAYNTLGEGQYRKEFDVSKPSTF